VQIQLLPDATMKIESFTQQVSHPKRGRKSKATAQILEESTKSIISNHGHKRKAVTTENNDEKVSEQEASKYLGYDGKFF